MRLRICPKFVRPSMGVFRRTSKREQREKKTLTVCGDDVKRVDPSQKTKIGTVHFGSFKIT